MLRTLSAGQVCRATLDRSHLVKDARSCSEIVQFRNGEPDVPRAYAAIAGDDFHQTLRMEKGSERNNTASTMLKIAVFAPTPNARDSTATIVKPGLFQSTRSPYRMSCNN